MRGLEKIRREKIQELKRIISYGIDPYPEETKRDLEIEEAIEKFSQLSRLKKEISLVGRLMAKRIHGGICFLDLLDGTGKIQVSLRREKVGERSFEFFLKNIERGDFVQVKGYLFKTKTGEKTLEVLDFKIISKAILPLPEKWHGLQDVEERFRKRYLDLIFNPEVKERFILRGEIIQKIREFFLKKGFLEVETPILQPIYGGGRAQPFKTHLNALKMNLYLRIAPELYLKRLIVGGFEKIFEMGKCFRNEGIDRFHNPDFTALEAYWAYASYKDLMALIEEMFQFLLKEIFKKNEILYQDQKINFKTPFKRVEFSHLFSREIKINYQDVDRSLLERRVKDLGIEIKKGSPKFEILDQLFKKIIRPKIFQPTFVINFPYGFQVLAKTRKKTPQYLANFQLIIAGIEMANAFSELNDPLEQRRRFEEQQEYLKEGYKESHPLDEDFLEALEYGMPPTAGLGIGIDRLILLLTNSYSLREVIFFPLLRSKQI